MCLYPKYIKNPKFKPTKKNGGLIPPINDARTLYVPVGCQDCIECRKQKAREWKVRLLEDIKTNTNGKFVALTFSDESYAKLANEYPKLKGYTLDNQIATRAVRLFLERWRKNYKKSLRHWLVTELGHKGTENIHLHGIIWTNEPIALIDKYWQYGWTWKGYTKNGILQNYVNPKTISYTTKYVHKQDLDHPHYKPVILTSPGIGSNYDGSVNKFKGEDTNMTYRTNTGHKMSLPIYWRNKIYSDEEKEKLWLQKLDEQTRYVLGVKIDISQNEYEYFNQVENARQLNRKMGYGNGTTTWNKMEYEEQRRILMQETRIRKGNNNNKKK